jgi:transcriptional regulator with XRE-family HTH domain|tara:strand:+ start:686 stop:823 length:138 start_codon:yes stop_codon:yes gene_type:complete
MKKFERNKEIRRLRKEKRMTLAAIGAKFGLSKQRVHQIVQEKSNV